MAKKALEEVEAGELIEDAPVWQRHKWTGQEVKFAAEYLRTGNAAHAYRHAFFDGKAKLSPKDFMDSRIRGAKLTKQPFMAGYIDEIRGEFRERMKLSAATVLEELAKLAYSNIGDFYVIDENGTPATDLSGLTAVQLAAVQELTIDTYMDGFGDEARPVKSVKVKLAPKTPALEALGRHFKLFTDVIEDRGLSDVAKAMAQARAERARRIKLERIEDGGEDN